MHGKKVRLCFVGNMLGRNPGYVTTQGQIVSDLFARAGYEVVSTSSKINKVARLADIIGTIVKNRKQIDVVVIEVYSGLSMVMADVASSLTKLFKLNLISVLHGGNLPQFAARHPNWTRRVLDNADILIAPSPFLAEKMAAYDFKVRVVPNVINIEEYDFKLRRRIAPKLIWMRSFHPVYNPQMALRVLAVLRKTEPNATLTMAGVDKGIESEIKALAAEMNLQNAVRFPGFLNMEEKASEFANADIYLNTNRVDNTPVSVIEACAFGLPVVATDVGGLAHIITNGKNGILVPDDDAEAMAAAVKRLLDNPDLTEKLSRDGRALAENYAWKSVQTKWEQLFAEVVG
jgi:L-malate glycosyltransferase